MDTKKCTTCKLELPKTEEFFYHTDKGRLRSECKTCIKAKAKRHHEKNRDRILARQKEKYSKEHNRKLCNRKQDRIMNHTDPYLMPYPEWRDAMYTLKEAHNLKWEEMERAAGMPMWSIRNSVRGRTWPPMPEEAEEIIAAIKKYVDSFEASDDAPVDREAWLKFCEDHRRKSGLTFYRMEKIMGVRKGTLDNQRRGKAAIPTKGEARRYLRRLHGLATELTPEEIKNIKYKTVRLPDGSFQTDVILNRPSVA